MKQIEAYKMCCSGERLQEQCRRRGDKAGVTKTKTLENEDLRPKTRSSFSYYENEDPVK